MTDDGTMPYPPFAKGLPFATGLPFAKGHGTGNDFVIVPDPDGDVDLTADMVAALCDRHRGLGADGLLRVVRSTAGDGPLWFMDYRNADGSLAELCGNGVRVYARYLVESGLAAGPRIPILTLAGPVVAEVSADSVAVDMPVTTVYGHSVAVLSGVDYAGTVVTCGNPNLVCRVDDPAKLDLLSGPPSLDAGVFAAGANVSFVGPTETEGGHPRVRVRVVERGVGETLSCGSGACAVAAAVLAEDGRSAGTVIVDTPGGRLTVTIAGGRTVLAGPAVIVATGEVRLPTP
jgi:diaminopimelate epimerase